MTAPERIWAFSADDIAENEGGATIVAHESYQPYATEYVRADLAAVQPDPNAGAVKVKPLVWEPVGNPNGRYRLHSTIAWARNTCPYGPYFIGLSSSCKNGEYSWDGPANTGKRGFADPESAKAAAQADYAARILDALEPQPDPRDEVIARLVDAASLVSDWDEWAFQVGGICPDRLVNCMGKLRAALAAAKEVQHGWPARG